MRAVAALLVLVFGATPVAYARSRPPALFHVSRDGRALEVRRNDDPVAVRVPVIDRCGEPAVGEPKIRAVRRISDIVDVTYGKHCFATVSLTTLDVECKGCD